MGNPGSGFSGRSCAIKSLELHWGVLAVYWVHIVLIVGLYWVQIGVILGIYRGRELL